MKFGLFSNGTRHNKIAKMSYDEDMEEVILADKLGMTEAWISEHGTFLNHQAPDQLPSADLFICKAAALTKQIKLGAGIRPLPYFHPLQVATESAVCDHLTGGRYLAGFGVGVNASNNKQRGPLKGEPRAMTREAVALIQKAWASTEPFDWNGEFWQGEGWHIIPKPLTDIEIGIACTRSDSTIELTAEMGFSPLFAWMSSAEQVRNMLNSYLSCKHVQGNQPDRGRARVARVVYVSDSVERAKYELRDADLHHAAPRLQHLLPAGSDGSDLSFETLINNGSFFCGDPDTVTRCIRQFYEEVGGFGTLLLTVGKDWSSSSLRTRSIELFATEVAPRLAHLQPSANPQ